MPINLMDFLNDIFDELLVFYYLALDESLDDAVYFLFLGIYNMHLKIHLYEPIYAHIQKK